MLKSNSKQLPADGKVNAKQLQVMQMFDWLGSWKGIEKVFNKDENNSFNFKKNVQLPLHFMLWDRSGKPLQHVISFWFWVKAI